MPNVFQFTTLEELQVAVTRTTSALDVFEVSDGPGPPPPATSTRPASGQLWPRGDKVPGQ